MLAAAQAGTVRSRRRRTGTRSPLARAQGVGAEQTSPTAHSGRRCLAAATLRRACAAATLPAGQRDDRRAADRPARGPGRTMAAFFWSLKPGDADAWRARRPRRLEGAGARPWPGERGASRQIDSFEQMSLARYRTTPRRSRSGGWPSSAMLRTRPARSSGKVPTWRCSMRARWRCVARIARVAAALEPTRQRDAGTSGFTRRCRDVHAVLSVRQPRAAVAARLDRGASDALPLVRGFAAAMVAGTIFDPRRTLALTIGSAP